MFVFSYYTRFFVPSKDRFLLATREKFGYNENGGLLPVHIALHPQIAERQQEVKK